MSDPKPKCPDHPEAGVTSARTPTEVARRWFCLGCGADLGPAPSQGMPEWEEFVLDKKGILDP